MQPADYSAPAHERGASEALAARPSLRRRLAGTSLPLVAAIVGVLAIAAWPSQEAPQSLDLTPLVAAQSVGTIAPAERPAPSPDSVEYTVQRNDTLDRIFRSVGIDLAALAELRARPEVRRALDIVRPGDTITFTHIDGALQSLNRQISNTLTLQVARSEDGFAVNYIENPLETELVGRRAQITSSLFAAGQDAGMSPETIMTLANQMFGWDIDFALDIREGDEFSVLYEQKYQDGGYVNDGRVLAAEFVNQGKVHRAVWFQSQDGAVEGYFTPDGRGMRKAFLRAPLDFTRISSVFNPRRKHPVSGVVRAHKGVDYAAPTGTPIWAAGEGRIQFAGRKGGYGNVVMIDHGKGISTVYGHMSRFGKSARAGRRIKQGDIIGYVGMTGTATGPHLHYEYRVKGAHKNPATIPMPRTEIPQKYMAEFHTQSTTMFARLDLTSGKALQRLASR
ncbi:MAG TPA: peptidoglycan DD-metalloendopeptidase family protein [Steroidobacteraceae bacterium]|nr:peptidoglycan DD-metalloendopeptidase family protein [Steroidobacteraceae bacterium]